MRLRITPACEPKLSSGKRRGVLEVYIGGRCPVFFHPPIQGLDKVKEVGFPGESEAWKARDWMRRAGLAEGRRSFLSLRVMGLAAEEGHQQHLQAAVGGTGPGSSRRMQT